MAAHQATNLSLTYRHREQARSHKGLAVVLVIPIRSKKFRCHKIFM